MNNHIDLSAEICLVEIKRLLSIYKLEWLFVWFDSKYPQYVNIYVYTCIPYELFCHLLI